MVAWSIEAAQASNLFDRIIVSTDDAEISEVAQAYGAEVPFIRPPELSNDYVGTTPVVAHATQWAIEQCDDLEAVCCIYPTAPFICFDDLKRLCIASRTEVGASWLWRRPSAGQLGKQ